MRIEDALESVALVDCSGRVTHRLTLLVDGRVRVRVGQVEGVVDPRRRTVVPPVLRLGGGEYSHDQIIDLAARLAPS